MIKYSYNLALVSVQRQFFHQLFCENIFKNHNIGHRIKFVSESGLPDGLFSNQKYLQIWVNFGGSCTGGCWYILWTLGPFYGLLLYFMDI
jgi:hypothetical protein